jgi:peptidoglycan/LPS O-acetylase OafA/YrhL
MAWLQRHAWQLLLALTLLIALIGINPVVNGINEDATVPRGIAGMTAAELAADNAQSFRLIDLQARFTGVDLIVIGLLLSAILVGAFRHHRRWAWWAMWLLPFWGASVFGLILATGIAPGQTPPNPFFSGLVVAVLASAMLLASAPLFFGPRPSRDSAGTN